MMLNKIKGSILGLSIGDALGSLAEGLDRAAVKKAYGGPITSFVDFSPLSVCPFLKRGQYCHKTQIFLLSLKTFVENKGFNEEAYIDKLIEWVKNEKEHRYPSGAHINAALSYLHGASPDDARVNSSEFDGVAPALAAGIYFWFDSERASEEARKIVSITHSADVILDISQILAFALSRVLNGIPISNDNDRIEFVELLLNRSKNSLVRSYLNLLQSTLMEGIENTDEAILKLGNGDFAPEVFSLSLFLFLKNPSFKSALIKAVNAYGDFGGCTSGIGLLTGAFSGAMFGIENIPENLVTELENSNFMLRLSEEIAK